MCRGLLIIHIEAYFSNLHVFMPGRHFYFDTQIFIIWMLMRELGRCLWAWPEKRKYAKIAKGHTDKGDNNLLIFSHARILRRLRCILQFQLRLRPRTDHQPRLQNQRRGTRRNPTRKLVRSALTGSQSREKRTLSPLILPNGVIAAARRDWRSLGVFRTECGAPHFEGMALDAILTDRNRRAPTRTDCVRHERPNSRPNSPSLLLT